MANGPNIFQMLLVYLLDCHFQPNVEHATSVPESRAYNAYNTNPNTVRTFGDKCLSNNNMST